MGAPIDQSAPVNGRERTQSLDLLAQFERRETPSGEGGSAQDGGSESGFEFEGPEKTLEIDLVPPGPLAPGDLVPTGPQGARALSRELWDEVLTAARV